MGAEEIRDARKAAGLTQKEMSELIGIPKRTIENWEQGSRKPSPGIEKLIIDKLAEIAKKKK